MAQEGTAVGASFDHRLRQLHFALAPQPRLRLTGAGLGIRAPYSVEDVPLTCVTTIDIQVCLQLFSNHRDALRCLSLFFPLAPGRFPSTVSQTIGPSLQ